MRTNDMEKERPVLLAEEAELISLPVASSHEISSPVAASIEVQLLNGKIEQLETQLCALIAIARNINANHDTKRLIEYVAERLQPFIEFDELTVSLLESEAVSPTDENDASPDDAVPGTTLHGIASNIKNRSFSYIDRRRTPDHSVWNLLHHGWTWSENDVEVRGLSDSDNVVRAFINVPLLCDGRPIGLLHFESFSPRDWSENEIHLARLVGEQIASTIQSTQILRDRAEQEAKLTQSLAVLQATQEAAAEGICLVDDSWQLVSFNKRFSELWNISPQLKNELKQSGQVMSHVLAQLADADEFIHKIWELHDHPAASTRDEIALVDGRTFERYSAPATSPTGESFGRIWTFSDISHRKEYESQLAHQAFHDAVTGLPNRVLLTNRLLAALNKNRSNQTSIAILFLDLDRFKVVNDSLGHDQGDQLLIQVGARLRASLRPCDMAARFGGDEFVVLLEEVSGLEDATKVADRIADSLKIPFLLNEHEVMVTASIGIMLGSGENDMPEDLLRKADVAMYRAKNSGKAQYQIFSEVSSAPVMERLQLELDLHSALNRNELEVFYQPIFTISNNEICAWEALLRWRHPVRGLVSPDQFITLAEETGQIVPFGLFVLREACRQMKKWNEGGGAGKMHVNLSARQFEQSDLVEQIEKILLETDLPASQLMLEITETTVMGDAKSAVKQLEHLKKLGVGIAIDDFGTGYSSLSYLEYFPIDMIKIDRSFIWRLHERNAIVRAITALGQTLNVNITAEGIETEAQLDSLRALDCQYGQGFLFSKPLPAAEAENLLHRQH